MNDLIDFALMRHGKLGEAISRREAEIEKFRKERDSLEDFVSSAKDLMELAASERHDAERGRKAEPAAARAVADMHEGPVTPMRPARSA